MAELKTRVNKRSVDGFLRQIKEERKRGDAFALLRLMRQATGMKPEMWGDSIVGFGRYHYKYESGREGDMPLIGFSPRKQNLTLYIMPGVGRYPALLKKLGKFKTGKACLYINTLADVDLSTLRELIVQSVRLTARVKG